MSVTTDSLTRETIVAGEFPLLRAATARAGISWAAALGGAAVAAAISIMLISFGVGLGFLSVSPFSGNNPSLMTFTVISAIWLIIVQWVSAFFGGYLAGRLRPSLTDVHTDEVGFRDTATGFVAWAVATLFVVAVVAGGATSAISGIGRAASSMAESAGGGTAQSGAAQAAAVPAGEPSSYLLDTLFRPSQSNPASNVGPAGNTGEAKAEAGRILATGATGDISQPDHDYLVQLVVSRTSLAPADAGKRVDEVIAQERRAIDKAKQAADAARKAAAEFSIYTAVSMLIGAFIACVAGAIGGRQRDAF
jgi:hypothetical protein